MIGTLKTVELHAFHGLKLTDIKVGEFIMQLHFGESDRIDAEEYWEYFDANGVMIDRYYSQKLRKTPFLLPRLIGHAMIESLKELSKVIITFDNQEKLIFTVNEEVTNLFTYDAKGSL